MVCNSIPIVVGVTGHRDLREENIPKLRELVASELEKIKTSYPNSEIVMLNSIAAGADSLCAEEALKLGIRLICVLPMAAEEYRKDFSAEEAETFDYLLDKASKAFAVPIDGPECHERDYYYRQAGIYVTEHCHVLLALWDGSPAQSGGCGTAEAADFMLNGVGDQFIPANDGAIIHIRTPRKKNDSKFSIESELIEKEEGSLSKLLEKTDEFNKNCSVLNAEYCYPLLDKKVQVSDTAAKIESVYFAADSISVSKQDSYMSILKTISIISVLLVLCFLLYDEVSLNICLAGFGVIALIYAVFYRRISGSNQHGIYLEYRALAESLRIQYYMQLLGIKDCICNDYTWTQQYEFTWIRKAVEVLSIGPADGEAVSDEDIKRCWIDGQKSYHEKAALKDGRRFKTKENITRCMLAATLFMWLLITILALFNSGILQISLGPISVSVLLNIIWGCISAVTVFASDYYGKMSLERKCEDHEKMAALFSDAAEKYDKYPQKRAEIFRNLAREEIIENGNWVSYCKENKPDFSI